MNVRGNGNMERTAGIPGCIWGLTVLLCLLVAGCAAVGPDYSGVAPEIGNEWHAAMDKGLTAAGPDTGELAAWWQVFDDPVLTKLEKEAVEGNFDLKIALSRLHQARLNRGITRSGTMPILGSEAQGIRQRTSESVPSSLGGEETNYFVARFDASWELDLFGGKRRAFEAAQAELEAGRAELEDVLTTLMAEVALNYIEVRTYQRRLAITRANIETQEKTYQLNRSRYQSGLIDELAVQQSLRNLERTRSHVAGIFAELTAAENRLAVLLGREPGALAPVLEPAGTIPEVPVEVAVGIPAEAMRRRPDIRRAERELAARTAEIGVATAELYPELHLFGTIGLEALDASGDFLDPQSRFWQFGPGMSWNIFQGRALRLNIELKTEKQKQALIAYKSSVLHARQEIENALTAYAREQEREASLQKSVGAAKRTEMLARDRYKAGLVDFYNVLDAQRSLLELEDELVRCRGRVASNLAALYKSLGGGWRYYSRFVQKKETGARAK